MVEELKAAGPLTLVGREIRLGGAGKGRLSLVEDDAAEEPKAARPRCLVGRGSGRGGAEAAGRLTRGAVSREQRAESRVQTAEDLGAW